MAFLKHCIGPNVNVKNPGGIIFEDETFLLYSQHRDLRLHHCLATSVFRSVRSLLEEDRV